MLHQSSSVTGDNGGKRGGKFAKIAGKGAFILLIFWLGLYVGSGRISVGRDYLSPVSKDAPANLNYSSVEQVYDSLRQNYDGDLDTKKLLDGAKEGLANASGDPYTEYFNATEAKKFHEQLSGSFQGIGAQLDKDENGNLVVVSPIAGFPADKAGLKAKDIIVEINGDSTDNLSIEEAVSRIRGPKDTKVTLKLVRNTEQVLTLTITRAEIKIPSVDSRMLNETTGYLKITEFSDNTADLAGRAAQKLKDSGAKSVVLDLRGNPGGKLDSAVDVSSLWLPAGKTVLTERRGGKVIQTYNASGVPILGGVPTVVLIDNGSASASEITAGALRDNGVARLMGVTSYGKGSVQQLVCFDGMRANNGDCLGEMLKVTIARWYTPGGKNIDKQGIKPDQEVKRSDDDIKAARDPQLDAAAAYLKNN